MRLISDPKEQTRIIENYIDDLQAPVRILEAGCGQKWPLSLKTDYRVTGVDLDEAALGMRKHVLGDLDEVRAGNLRDNLFGPRSFDVIYSAFVLEHVRGTAWVMDNFVRWLRPDGLLIVQISDRESVQGFIARLIPSWLHKYIYGIESTEKAGYCPYQTYYEKTVSRCGIWDFCDDNGFTILEEIGTNNDLDKRPVMKFLVRMVSLLTFGSLKANKNLTYVLQKRMDTHHWSSEQEVSAREGDYQSTIACS